MKPGDPRISRGENHPRWKGTAVGYAGGHNRVRESRGSAVACIFGCNAQRYEWANLTGRYHDPADYASMCGTCHNRYDQARKSMESGFTTVCGWPVQIRSNAVPPELEAKLARARSGTV